MESQNNKQATINLTVTDFVHEKLKKEADERGVSINQLITEIIEATYE